MRRVSPSPGARGRAFMVHPSYDWASDWRGYASREARDDALETERHDAFLRSLADDEYWVAVRGAKALHDLACGSAADKFGHGTDQHCAAIDDANRAFDLTVAAARAERLRR